MTRFDASYANWLLSHKSMREGERMRRLEEGHGHAEKLFVQSIWWPAVGDFNYLHPEFEVYDFKDGRRFLDFAWIYGSLYLVIEIDGYKSHVKLDRNRFSDNLTRQNDLINDGWKILRFSYDDIVERPRGCQQQVQQFIGRWAGIGRGQDGFRQLNVWEREIIRFASRRGKSFGYHEVILWLDLHRHTAGKLLNGLLQKNWIIEDGSGPRGISLFKLNRTSEITF